MAGEFVVWKMKQEEVDRVLAAFPGSNWTGVAHAAGTPAGGGGLFPGWNALSRAELARVRDGRGGLANRNNLPPHRYIEIPAGAVTPVQRELLFQWYWVNDLQHPTDPGFGSAALTANAAASWGLGKKRQALIDQIAHGATSIEVYYIGSKEMN